MNNRLREPRRFIRQEAFVALVALLGPTLSPDGRYLFFTRYARTATSEQEDIIAITVTCGYDIGVASGHITEHFQHSPEEWGRILEPTK
jgi:hypothetical protein